MIVEHSTEEACMSKTLLCRLVSRIDSIDYLVGIAYTTISNLPGIVNLINRWTPVMTMQVDISISPAHTNTGRNHILVRAFLQKMEHAKPVFYQITILCC